MGSSNDNLRSFLAGLFRTAVSAAHPATCLPPLLPSLPPGRLILLAAGKAAGSMAETAETHYLDRMRIAAERLTGVAVARHGYARHLRKVRMIEAGHPIPDAAGLEAADRALALADGAGANDLVLVLMSGAACSSGKSLDHRHLGCAGRRSVRDRLRANRSRSDDAGRRARHHCEIQNRGSG